MVILLLRQEIEHIQMTSQRKWNLHLKQFFRLGFIQAKWTIRFLCGFLCSDGKLKRAQRFRFRVN